MEEINETCKSETPSGIRLSQEVIETYIKELEAGGYSSPTQENYRRYLERLYRFLPEQKYIQDGTLTAWQKHLLESGCSASAVNTGLAAANSLMRYLGRKDLQAERVAKQKENIQPELTRAEYLRLLSAARTLGKERIYLLVKIFGTTGMTVGELENLTVEAVQAGRLTLPSGALRIPGGLREELSHFAETEGIHSGPVFLSGEGTPTGRTVVTAMIKSLCRDARVSEEKANPRCLRKLYLTTQKGIRENFAVLMEQAYERLLEQEQQIFGWEMV